MIDEMKGEMRRNITGAGWQGHLVICGRTMVLTGTLAEDDDGKFLQIEALMFGSPYTEADLARLDYARANAPKTLGFPEQLHGRTRMPEDPIPAFTGAQGS